MLVSTVEFPLVQFLHVYCIFSVKFVLWRKRLSQASVKMFVLIWATLLLFVRNSNADSGVSVWGRQNCDGSYCITLIDGEIIAEAGLCVVIPCSFTVHYDFTPQNLIWYKCEPTKQRCGDSDIIFHTNKFNKKVQPKFRGRVSLLEPDVSLKNCSIIINDLSEADSGSYQLRVNGLMNGISDGITFSSKATVSIKGLSQKPTVMIPPLTAGQQSTLTCTAPGLCSGSDPKITWMWSGAGEEDSHISGNITDFKTEHVTAVTQRHSSTLTFKSSAEHHSTNVTCQVSFKGDVTTEETVTLSVNCPVQHCGVLLWAVAGVSLSVNIFYTVCVVFFCKARKKLKPNQEDRTYMSLQKRDGSLEYNFLHVYCIFSVKFILWRERLSQASVKMFVLIWATLLFSVTNSNADSVIDDLQAVHLIPFMDWSPLGLSQKPTVMIPPLTAGQQSTLTCTAPGLCSGSDPKITWMWSRAGEKDSHITGNITDFKTEHVTAVTQRHSSTLTFNSSAEHHSTNVTCQVSFRGDVTTEETVFLIVNWFSKILNNSGCEVQSEVLTCVCISEGFPLPTIKWPLLKTQAEYSVITTVSNYTVNSTFILTVNDHCNSSVECVSSNENGEAKENLTTRTNLSKQDDQYKKVLKLATRLETIVAFLIGVLLSTIICCLANKFHRIKQKSSGNLDETLEMVASLEDPLIYDDQTQDPEAPEDGTVAAEKTGPETDSGLKDVEYASIDFSLLKRKSPRVAAEKQETTETEYAEIKKEVKEEREDYGGQKGEVLESKEEVIIEEDEETQHCVTEEEEGEDMAVYSNVRDIMGEM
ncbi:uncharacterized protein LOC121185531 [Toxotes jaculatrix]|uniref:uncharacterized protein LOC121185531 n=1 Tax=Toxotes jaculatrix TaxID=941984 RepID=UPI001B3A8C3E|nr:uncharacterized protein LOC121185531 [Toxotes jaculatrix]